MFFKRFIYLANNSKTSVISGVLDDKMSPIYTKKIKHQ